ncbi:MAG: hypothetical protein R2800_15145 [Flavipsychrobacter sp.]
MKRLMYGLLLLSASVPASACDVCSASTGGQSLGMLPQLHRHFVGVQYQYRHFSSLQKGLTDASASKTSEQYFQTMQLWGRYTVGEKIQLFGFLPYHSNASRVDGINTIMQGVGDATFLANVILLKSADTAKWKHTLQAGAGVKMPLGSYKGITELEQQGLPNIQPGSASWDFPVNANYTIKYKRVGANLDANYTITTANSDSYKFGDRLSTQLTTFYQWQQGKVTVLPQLGMRYEYSLHNYDNYKRKWLNTQTGGTIIYASAGAQVYYGKAGIQLSYYKPMTQQYASGNVIANSRADIGFVYLFE